MRAARIAWCSFYRRPGLREPALLQGLDLVGRQQMAADEQFAAVLYGDFHGASLAATAPRSAACLLPEQSHWNLVDWLLEGCFPGPWFARVKSAFQAQLDPQLGCRRVLGVSTHTELHYSASCRAPQKRVLRPWRALAVSGRAPARPSGPRVLLPAQRSAPQGPQRVPPCPASPGRGHLRQRPPQPLLAMPSMSK